MTYSNKAVSSFILGLVFLLIILPMALFNIIIFSKLSVIVLDFLFYGGSITGLILGIKGFRETKNSQIRGKWMTVLGIIFSILVIIITTLIITTLDLLLVTFYYLRT